MVAWAIKGMGGMIPKMESRLLADNQAEQAYNCDLASGALNGLPIPELAKDLTTVVGPVRKAYRFPDPTGAGGPDVWLPLPSEFSSVVRSPLANDTTHRLYWTNPGDLSPHFNARASLPSAFDLGVFQPGNASVTAVATGGSALPVARSYVYTFLNAFGEESSPSVPSAIAQGPSDATWTITGLPTTAPANPVGRNYPAVTLLNLYRTVSGANTGGQFFLVAQFNYGTGAPPASYVDPVEDIQAVSDGITLPSSGWANPPDNLDGLTALPGGMLVGFTDNTIHFCEPNRPHTWPPAYDQSLQYKIVGLGVWQQSLVVLTTGYPSTGSGNSPANYVFTQVRVPEPCIARGSIITDLMGVYYASQNGLVMLNYYGMQNQTLSAVTKNIWLNEYHAASIIACRHRAQYLAINGTGVGFLIDYSEARLGFEKLSTLNGAVSIWNDEYSGDAYIMGGDKKVYLWDSPNAGSMVFRWRSKQFYNAAPISLGACQISADPSITTAIASPPPAALDNGDAALVLPNGVNAQFRLYAGPDGQHLVHTRNLRDAREIFRLPSGFKAFDWQCEIVSRVPIHSIELATTMRELKGV